MPAAPKTPRLRFQAQRVIPLKRARFWLICLFFFLWAATISTRLFWLQVVRHKDFLSRAQHQQQRIIELAPRRGVLYDRNLHELAMTVQVDSIYADPSQVDDKQALAHQLAALVHTDPDDQQTSEAQIFSRLQNGHNFAWIARRVRPEISDAIKKLNLKGIFFQKEFQRFYPDKELAAQVLGYVGVDDNGLGGLEQKFDSDLHGTPGTMNAAFDARRHILGSQEYDPHPGRSMVLTLDENIQFQAEQALDHAMERTDADNGTIVVQDVHTGQILALAIRPTYNPNQLRHTSPALLRDHAVSDVYEPGSTFKLVTYSAALDQHVVTPEDIVDCQGSVINVAGRTIHDDKGDHFGRITVTEALEHSSNVGAIKLALGLGNDRFNQYIRAFGFGSRSGIELPDETRGLLRPLNRWSASSIASIAMGQEVAVTPIQLATMVSTIANGGVYMPPHILLPNQNTTATQGNQFKPGEDLPNPLPADAHRVITSLTAAEMRKMLEGVVLYGTGKQAQLNGYSSGGKTGTAQKIDPKTHTYSKSMHVASFAGFAPVNNPVIAVAVIMDNPKKGYYGAEISAPVFAEVAQRVLEYLGVPHDTPLHAVRNPASLPAVHEDEDSGGADLNALYDAANTLPSDDPLRNGAPQNTPAPTPPQQQKSKSAPQTVTLPVKQTPQPGIATKTITIQDGKKLSVPSLTGLPVRKVIELAASSGINVQIVGSGNCRQQMPAPGTMVAAGTRVIVRCGR